MSIRAVLSSLTETSRCNQTYVAKGFIKKYTQFDVPCAIVLVIAVFSSRIIPFGNFPFYTTMKEDLKLIQILQQTLGFKIASFKSKFKATKYKFSTSKFHEICNKKSPNGDLILMKSQSTHCIFGAYTTEAWKLNETDKTKSRVIFDSKSFIVIVRYDNNDIIHKSKLPIILLPKEKDYTPIISAQGAGPMFGLNDIVVGFSGHCGYSRLTLYGNSEFPQLKNVCGGNTTVLIEELLGESNVKVYRFMLDELEVLEVLKI